MWRQLAKIALFLGLGLGWSVPGKSQVDSCYERYTQASQLYEAGKLAQVIQTLSPCLIDRYQDRVLRRNMLNLATESYIFMDSTQLARRTLLDLLRLDPFYKVNKDIPEMQYLREEVVTFPAMEFSTFFSPYLFTRANFSSDEVIAPGVLTNRKFSLKGVDGDYDVSWGFNTGIEAAIALHRYSNIDIHIGLNVSRYSFRYIMEMDNVPNFEGVPDQATLFVAEKHFWLRVPLYLSWNLIPRENIVNSHWVPYVYAGASYDRLLEQTAKLSSLRLSFPPDEKFNLSAGEKIGAYRRSSNTSLLGGIGVKLHLHQTFLLFDLQYAHTLGNLRDTAATRYQNGEYRFLDNDFQLSNVSLRLGIGTFLFRAKIK